MYVIFTFTLSWITWKFQIYYRMIGNLLSFFMLTISLITGHFETFFFLILNKLNLFVYYYYFCIINVYLTTHSITGIGLTTPAGMTYTPLQADASRNKTMFVRSTWTPQQNQVGSHILCALAEDVLGYKLL